MTVDELMRIVELEGLATPLLYGEGTREDTVVLERDNQEWTVYATDERGSAMAKTRRTFTTESEALEYVVTKLRQVQKANRSLKDLFKKKRTPSVPTHIRQVNGSHRGAFRDTMRSYEEMERQQLNAAIVAYIGDGAFPRRDQAAVKELVAGGEEALLLIAKVMDIVDGALSVEIDWSTHTLTQAGDEVKRVVSTRYLGLNEKTLDKLAWAFMYNNK